MLNLRVVIFLLATILGLVGCADRDEIQSSEGIEFHSQSDNKRLILFVHGFTGNSEDTWTHERAGESWPKLAVRDTAFSEADIATYSYSTQLFENSFSVDELADNLRLRLQNEDILSHYSELVFVSHSMGGLVVTCPHLVVQSLS